MHNVIKGKGENVSGAVLGYKDKEQKKPVGESMASKLLTLVLELFALASALSCNT